MGVRGRLGEVLHLLKKPMIGLVTIPSLYHILTQFNNNKLGKHGAEMAQRSLKSTPHSKL